MKDNYVLVVEDDEFYAKIFQAKITEAGMKVVPFLVADKALEYAKANPPTLIISDLVMPRMDGFKFMEMVRMVDSLKNIPILVFSNLGQEKDIAEAKRLGATEYFVKTEISLSDAIDKILQYYQRAV